VEKAGAEPVVRIALTDITERKQAEEELRIAAIAFELHDGMMVTTPMASSCGSTSLLPG